MPSLARVLVATVAVLGLAAASNPLPKYGSGSVSHNYDASEEEDNEVVYSDDEDAVGAEAEYSNGDGDGGDFDLDPSRYVVVNDDGTFSPWADDEPEPEAEADGETDYCFAEDGSMVPCSSLEDYVPPEGDDADMDQYATEDSEPSPLVEHLGTC